MPGIEHPGSTGVIYCSERAMANGFSYAEAHEWANLGQGAPEVGPIPNAPERPNTIPVPLGSLEYAPTTGLKRECYTFLKYLFASNTCHVQNSVKRLPIFIITHTAKARKVSTRTKMSALCPVAAQAFRESPQSLAMFTA